MDFIQNSFSKKRALHYDHYDRSNPYNMSFEQRGYHPPSFSADRPSTRRPFMPGTREFEQSPPPSLTSDPNFDILDWHPAYQSCQRFFLDHAQHEAATQSLCALMNIRLPFQYMSNPVESSTPPHTSHPPPVSQYPLNFQRGTSPPHRPRGSPDRAPPTFVSLIPYIKRLVVTGFDKPPILHGLFGDNYKRGVLPHLECERRNYLFAAKQGGWGCKQAYDQGSGTGGDESVPFIKPLQEAKIEELRAAEKAWSEWLAMEDWMVGPHAPKEDPEPRVAPRRHANGDGGVAMNGNGTAVLPDSVPEAFEQQTADEANGNGHSRHDVREPRPEQDR